MKRISKYRKSSNFIIGKVFFFLFFLSLILGFGYSIITTSLKISGSVTIKNVENIPMLRATSSSDTTAFWSSTYRMKIKTVTFDDEINEPSGVVASWDVGTIDNITDVMAYIVNNETSGYYDLYIQGDGHLYANYDSSYLFYNFRALEKINNIDILDTSKTTNMSYMFYYAGYSSTNFTLDVSSFDTQNVTNMSYMFAFAGYNSTAITLDISNFDTSKVTSMYYIFGRTGYVNPNFTLNVSGINTKNVTDMGYMFYNAGYNSEVYTLDVTSFDTSNVTNME